MIKTDQQIEHITENAVRFSSTGDLEPLIQAAGNAKYVLLGEASHGTSEFYTVRAEITKRLIEEHGFSFVAVEGDWPACYEINRYIKGFTQQDLTAEEALKKSFHRWPTWMWANKEVVELIEWLAAFNQRNRQQDQQIGFYGLDVYSLWESMEAIIEYLEKINSPDLDKAKAAMDCFEPYHRKPEMYGISAAFYGEDCMEEIIQLLQGIHENKSKYEEDPEASLNLKINAITASNAENYYHTMVTNDNESWNIRDRHMTEALTHISEHYGRDAKGIIWEHNTHIGDARATDMAREDLVNVGQLTREQFGPESIYSIGFGTHHGTVIAAKKWGETAEIMTVPKATPGSWEDLLHDAGPFNKYLLFTEKNQRFFRETVGHRAIGVVYDPRYEHYGNYVPSQIADRYDAFIHVDETKALTPL